MKRTSTLPLSVHALSRLTLRGCPEKTKTRTAPPLLLRKRLAPSRTPKNRGSPPCCRLTPSPSGVCGRCPARRAPFFFTRGGYPYTIRLKLIIFSCRDRLPCLSAVLVRCMRCVNRGGWPYRTINNHIVYFLNNHTCRYSTLYPPRITSRLVTFQHGGTKAPQYV